MSTQERFVRVTTRIEPGARRYLDRLGDGPSGYDNRSEVVREALRLHALATDGDLELEHIEAVQSRAAGGADGR